MIRNLKHKIQNFRKGFSLIELMVAMFIFGLVMVAMVAVSVAGFRSYGKSKAIKAVTEDVGFAINSIAKDARMGKIESDDSPSSRSLSLKLSRNADQAKICYVVSSSQLQSCDIDCASNCKSIVDLSASSMVFDTTTSGFRNQKTDLASATKIRGWVEINLNIASPSMEKDSIYVQTIVSSRDYGWEDVLP
jgi:prepilin-type N-terminal cleavage/methylation domain-containing protein